MSTYRVYGTDDYEYEFEAERDVIEENGYTFYGEGAKIVGRFERLACVGFVLEEDDES